ncbi:MAG: rhomboid family intramembrane serine protease [Anaerolineae bacterium]|nr:rhomboid family intramembrane serine protease [Anaerolineae bacterium]
MNNHNPLDVQHSSEMTPHSEMGSHSEMTPDSEMTPHSEMEGDDVPAVSYRLPSSRVVVTYVIIGLNIVIFLLTLLAQNLMYGLGGLVPAWVVTDKEWWRLLTTGFLHGDVIHIFSNLYALYALGRQVERLFGPGRFTLIYLVGLLGASILVTLLGRLDSLTVGASGAVMGVLGALFIYYRQYREQLSGGRWYAQELLKTAGLNLIIGFLPGISMWGHLGGFLAGAMVGWALSPHYHWEETPILHLEKAPVAAEGWRWFSLMMAGWLVLLGFAFLWRA